MSSAEDDVEATVLAGEGIVIRKGWREIRARSLSHMRHLPRPAPEFAEAPVSNVVIRVSGDMAWMTYDKDHPLVADLVSHGPNGRTHNLRILERRDGRWLIALSGVLDPSLGAECVVRVARDGRILWKSRLAVERLRHDPHFIESAGRLKLKARRFNARLERTLDLAVALDTEFMPRRGLSRFRSTMSRNCRASSGYRRISMPRSSGWRIGAGSMTASGWQPGSTGSRRRRNGWPGPFARARPRRVCHQRVDQPEYRQNASETAVRKDRHRHAGGARPASPVILAAALSCHRTDDRRCPPRRVSSADHMPQQSPRNGWSPSGAVASGSTSHDCRSAPDRTCVPELPSQTRPGGSASSPARATSSSPRRGSREPPGCRSS